MKKKIFKIIFTIPSAIWIIISILAMIESQGDSEPLTIAELVVVDTVLILGWLIILYIISTVINFFSKDKEITPKDDRAINNISSKKEDIKINTKKEDKKILYTCNSVINAYEYKLMIPYFKNIYWSYIIKKSLSINCIICMIYIIMFGRYLLFVLPIFIILQLILIIYYKKNFNNVIEKDFKKNEVKNNINNNYSIDFFEDYLYLKNEVGAKNFYYKDIIRSVETDTNFYLENVDRNIIIIQKNECELELINFIRDKLKELENDLGNISRLKKMKKSYNPYFIKNIMVFLFIITIASLWGALYSVALVNKVIPQYGFSFVKNLWVFWCWLPIPILSIILGFKYKKKGIKCTKNIVGGFIIGFLLLIYGSFCMFPTFAEDYSKIYEYKDIINAKIPLNGYLEIQKWGNYVDEDKTEYVFISAYYDEKNADEFVKSIENNEVWINYNNLKSDLKIYMPSYVALDLDAYISIYNKTTNQYNLVPETTGDYEIYVMKYDKSDKKLEIHKFKYSYKK